MTWRIAEETSALCKPGLLTKPRRRCAGRRAALGCSRAGGAHPTRVVWGSDWPVLELAASYATWWDETQLLLADLAPAERDAVLGGNAMRLYGGAT
jgi:L-fuconolactonase